MIFLLILWVVVSAITNALAQVPAPFSPTTTTTNTTNTTNTTTNGKLFPISDPRFLECSLLSAACLLKDDHGSINTIISYDQSHVQSGEIQSFVGMSSQSSLWPINDPPLLYDIRLASSVGEQSGSDIYVRGSQPFDINVRLATPFDRDISNVEFEPSQQEATVIALLWPHNICHSLYGLAILKNAYDSHPLHLSPHDIFLASPDGGPPLPFTEKTFKAVLPHREMQAWPKDSTRCYSKVNVCRVYGITDAQGIDQVFDIGQKVVGKILEAKDNEIRRENLILRVVFTGGRKGSRELYNMKESIDLCNSLKGFLCSQHTFGKLGLEEDIALMQQTDVLVGIHGAALTNSIFMREGSHVVEIRCKVSPHYAKEHYETYLKKAGFKVRWWLIQINNGENIFLSDFEIREIGVSSLWNRDLNMLLPLNAIEVMLLQIQNLFVSDKNSLVEFLAMDSKNRNRMIVL